MILGLGFMAHAGKDLVADHLVQCHGFKKIAFADALKDGVRAIFKLSEEQLYGDKKEVPDEFWEDTPRNIFQQMGTECMQRYRKDIWVRAAFRTMQEDGHKNWVFSDVRFVHEAEALKQHGGVLVRIDRPLLGKGAIATKLHASETSMINYEGWDHVIVNDNDIVTLLQRVNELMGKIQ